MVRFRIIYHCCFVLVIGYATTAPGQQYPIVEVIAPGQVIGAYEPVSTESYVVIEDRLIDERPLNDGVLPGHIIETTVPLVSEQIEMRSLVVAEELQAASSTNVSTVSKDQTSDQISNEIAALVQRSVKLEEDLAVLKELLEKHLETADQQQAEVTAKLAEAINQRDDARTKFEASFKEFAIRNEQVVALAVGLREAYDRLEAKRAQTGDASEKSIAMASDLKKQVAKIESEFEKSGESMKVAMAQSNDTAEKLKQQFSELGTQLKSVVGGAEKQKELLGKFEGEVAENAESVESIKKMISALEDRVKALEKNRGKPKPKKDE